MAQRYQNVMVAIDGSKEADLAFVKGVYTALRNESISTEKVTSEKPSFEMVAEKKVEKAFFLKVWWNRFIRFINEKL